MDASAADTAPAPADHALVVYSDIGCPWAHVLTHRLEQARHSLGLDDELAVDHRAFPLELVNRRPTPKAILDAEVSVLADVEPGAGWSTQDPDPWTYPVSTLPALEAVQAAKMQSSELSIALDLALRRAMFEDWACLSVHGVVVAIAATVDGLDTDELWSCLGGTGPRADVWHQFQESTASGAVAGSPTVMLPDGSAHHNPGFEITWEGEDADRKLVIETDDAAAVRRIVEDAAAVRVAD